MRQQLVQELRDAFDQGLTRDLAGRRKTLRALAYMLEDNRSAIAAAYAQDLGWKPEEVYLLELDRCMEELLYLESHLNSLSKPTHVSGGMVYPFSSPHITRDPYGVVLILGAWNYPLQLSLMPLWGAIASGNTVVLKLSEFAPTINHLLAGLLEAVLDPKLYRVVQGDATVSQALTQAKTDFILFTGNGAVGKMVYKAAAEHLTPVALELGGMCPAIVDGTFDLDLAAKRIVWASFTNAGQTCVAINHVIVLKEHYTALIQALQKWIAIRFPDTSSSQKIINERHFSRLQDLLKSTKGTVHSPSPIQSSKEHRVISPTIVTDLQSDDPILADEIFGPICPILAVDTVQDAIRFARTRGAPLALYVFSSDSKTQKLLKSCIPSGAVVYNDAMLQMGLPTLPFGGVGQSGFGRYHGRRTFELFTYERSIMYSPGWFEPLLNLRYPPLDGWKYVLISLLMRKKIHFPRPGQASSLRTSGRMKWAAAAAFAALLAVLAKPKLWLNAKSFLKRP